MRELPDLWNARMQEYLGLVPDNDAKGILQDIHWSIGAIGYFATYTLGNLISAQLWEHSGATSRIATNRSGAATSPRSSRGCARTCIGSAASTSRRSSSSASPDRGSIPSRTCGISRASTGGCTGFEAEASQG